MNPTISVIICVYNGENYIANAIQSVLDQTYPYVELIIVDDGSNDATASIVKGFGDRLRYLYQPNKGVGSARNYGIRHAKGQYFSFLDHDDLWTPCKLDLQMQAMKKENELDPLIFSHISQFFCPSLSEEERNKLIEPKPSEPACLTGTLLISRKRVDQIGSFMEENEVGDFIEWYSRAYDLNVPIKMLSEVTLYRRVHMSNMGRNTALYNKQDYIKRLKTIIDRRRELQRNAR